MEAFESRQEQLAYEEFWLDYKIMFGRLFELTEKPIDIYTAQERLAKLTKAGPIKEKLKKQPLSHAICYWLDSKVDIEEFDPDYINGVTAREYNFLISLMSNLGVVELIEDREHEEWGRFKGIDLSPKEMFKKYYVEEYVAKFKIDTNGQSEAEPGNE